MQYRSLNGHLRLISALVALAATAACAPAPSAPSPGPASAPAAPKEKTKMTLILGLPLGNPANSFYWIGKDLGYHDEEGIDVTVESTGGQAQRAVAMVIGGQGEAAAFSLESILGPAAQGQDMPLVAVYTVYPRAIYVGATLPESGIRGLADLKGKTIGVPQTGPTYQGYLGAALKEVGLSLSDVELLATGIGPPMAEALQRGEISAMFGTTGQISPLETQGYKFRYLPRPKIAEELLGTNILMKRDLPPEKKQAVRGWLRAFAKSILFAKENPEAAVLVNWEMYAESKPKGISEEEALKNAVHILKAALGFTDKQEGKWGYTTPAKATAYARFLGHEGKLRIEDYYTNEMIDFVNQFDEEKIRQQARSFKRP